MGASRTDRLPDETRGSVPAFTRTAAVAVAVSVVLVAASPWWPGVAHRTDTAGEGHTGLLSRWVE